MPRPLLAAFVAVLATAACAAPPAAEPVTVAADDWPWWRGPNRDGVATGSLPPLTWSETENVLWKAAVPGRGHGSPAVVGDRVFLATADEEAQTQSVLCYGRADGKLLWQTEVHRGGFDKKGNEKSSYASCTPACDGRRVFANFQNRGAVRTTALSLDGKILWQTKVSDFVVHQGFGSSPAVYQGLVIVAADNKGGGAVAGLDRATGAVVWSRERPKTANYASPIILTVAGREQLVLIGCELVTGLDPLTGKQLWEIPGSTTECVTSTPTDGKHIFTTGGYPKNHVAAVRADGSGKVVWENATRVYVPSLLVKGEHLYGVLDAGQAVCWECATGKEVWKGRLGGTFSSSPVLVGDHVLATNEAGKTFVFEATPAEFRKTGQCQLGDEAFATPTVCGGRAYLRVASRQGGSRQETLYCVGRKE
jgi:outer membrane protein assembly factor BamB